MNFDYKFERKDFEKFLRASNRKYNYICLLLFTIFYFAACLDLLSTNHSQILTSFGISILILFSILSILTIVFAKIMVKRNDKLIGVSYGIYHIELTNDKIIEQINEKCYEMKYDDISRISKSKKGIVIYSKDNMMFIFNKKGFLKAHNYEKCVNAILKRYHKEVVKELAPKKKKSSEEVIKTRKRSVKKK